jgi:hypothetical protein
MTLQVRDNLLDSLHTDADTPIEDTLIMIGNNNQSALALGPATKFDAVCKIMDALSGKMGAGR